MQQTVFNIIFSLLLVLAISQQNILAPQPETLWGSLQPFLPFRPSAQSESESPVPAPARSPNPVPRQAPEPTTRSPRPAPSRPAPSRQAPQPQQHVLQPTPQRQSPETRVPQPAPYKAPEAPWGSPQPFMPFRPSPQSDNEKQPQPNQNPAPQPYKAPEAPWGSPQPFMPFRPSPQSDNEKQPQPNQNPEPAMLVPTSNDDSSTESRNQEQKIRDNALKIKEQCDQFLNPDEATTTAPQTNLRSNTITVTMTVTFGNTGNQQTLAKICSALRTACSQNSGRDFNDCVWNRTSQAGAVWEGSTVSPALVTETPNPTTSPVEVNDNGAGGLFTSILSIILIIGIGFLL
jgi:hypothetical protein